MNDAATEIFIALKTYSNEGLEPMRGALKVLSVHFSIERVSSIYNVHRRAENLTGLRDIRKEEFMQGLALVFKARTRMSAEEAIAILRQTEDESRKDSPRRSVSLNLLMFGDKVVMSPNLALPHPEMHLRPEEIVLINEIQGDIVHPVIGERLSDLAQRFSNMPWGDFFAQGAAALDFSITNDNQIGE